MPAWVLTTLGGNGLAGVFIFVLLCAALGLWAAYKSKDRELKKLHEERALEREAMARLLEQNNNSSAAVAAATDRRNEVMMAMAQALSAMTNALDKYDDRVKMQATMLAEKFSNFHHVVDSFGESNRTITGLISEIRNLMTSLMAEMRVLSASKGN
jgi:hypothetical protein